MRLLRIVKLSTSDNKLVLRIVVGLSTEKWLPTLRIYGTIFVAYLHTIKKRTTNSLDQIFLSEEIALIFFMT
jgi:hypothetical protein